MNVYDRDENHEKSVVIDNSNNDQYEFCCWYSSCGKLCNI